MTNAPMTFDPKEARTLVEHFKNDQPVTQDMQSTMMAEEMQLAADALAAALDENHRLRQEVDEARADTVAISEMAAALIEDMSKNPTTTWGQLKAAVRALGDLGDRYALRMLKDMAMDDATNQLEHANQEIDRLREALSFYADVKKYPAPLTGGLAICISIAVPLPAPP